MPRYTFTTADGESVDLQMSMSEHAKRVKHDVIVLDDGRIAKTDWNWGASSNHRAIATCPANYPQTLGAAGVHPSQIKEHMAYLKSQGCGQINHTADGDPVVADKHQRRKVVAALGLFDRNAGYYDAAPVHRTAPVRRFR